MIVLFFARTRDLAGVDRVQFTPAPANVGMLRTEIAGRFPKLAGLLDKCAVAVGNEFAGDDAVLQETDEVALLPPVSGG